MQTVSNCPSMKLKAALSPAFFRLHVLCECTGPVLMQVVVGMGSLLFCDATRSHEDGSVISGREVFPPKSEISRSWPSKSTNLEESRSILSLEDPERCSLATFADGSAASLDVRRFADVRRRQGSGPPLIYCNL